MDIEQIKKEDKKKLSEKRFTHTLNVMEKCEELAKKYGENVERAKLVGLTHDIAKEMTTEEMLEYVKVNNIKIDEIEEAYPKLLHAKIGADICTKKYGFDKEMAKAIEAHTTGQAKMSKLGKILYISDAISAERDYDYVPKARELSQKSLDDTMLYLLKTFVADCKERNKKVHPDAIKAINDLEERER